MMNPTISPQQMWSGVAWAWAQHAAFVDARGAETTELLLAATRPQPGEHVLELACGAGGPGLAAAALVAPDGEVVLSDVSAEMTAIATARAAALGLGNVSSRVLDLEQIDEPDAAYDVVLCREGLMLAPDPARAAREITRVLRPGGRAGATPVRGDAGDLEGLRAVFEQAPAAIGPPDVVVNAVSAGRPPATAPGSGAARSPRRAWPGSRAGRQPSPGRRSRSCGPGPRRSRAAAERSSR